MFLGSQTTVIVVDWDNIVIRLVVEWGNILFAEWGNIPFAEWGNILFAGVYVGTFQPEHFSGWGMAVKGLKRCAIVCLLRSRVLDGLSGCLPQVRSIPVDVTQFRAVSPVGQLTERVLRTCALGRHLLGQTLATPGLSQFQRMGDLVNICVCVCVCVCVGYMFSPRRLRAEVEFPCWFIFYYA